MPKRPDQLTPFELANDVVNSWKTTYVNTGDGSGKPNLSMKVLQNYIAAAVFFEREHCARHADRNGAGSHIVNAIRNGRPGGMVQAPNEGPKIILPDGFKFK